MGEGSFRVEPRPAELERDIERIRGTIDGVVAELDQRRQDLLDWRLQWRKNRPAISMGAGGLLLLLGGAIFLAVQLRARRQRPAARMRRYGEELRRRMAPPERGARRVGMDALSSAAAMGSGTLAREFVRRTARNLAPR